MPGPYDLAIFVGRNLAGGAVLAASVWVFGETVLRRLGIVAPRHARRALAVALGLGIVAQALLVVGLLGWLRREVVLVLLALGHLTCLGTWRLWGRRSMRWRRSSRRRAACWRTALGGLILSPCAVLALYPPTGFDATLYHLPYVQAFIAAERLVFVPGLRFPVFPQVVEMGFVLGFLIAGEAVAQLSSLLAMAATAGLILDWPRLPRPVRLMAAALWLGTPLVVWLGASAYVDLGLALFVVAACYCWQRWHAAGDRPWLALAGIFLGLAAGTKYLGLFFCILLVLLALPRIWRTRTPRSLAVLILACALTLAPWYLRNIYHTGNPVHPFYSDVFGVDEWSVEHRQSRPDETLAGRFGSLLRLPWTSVFERERFNYPAPLSPWYLLLIPLGAPLALRAPPTRRLLLISFAYGLFWLTGPSAPRYFMPVLPLANLALIAGAAGVLDALATILGRRPMRARGRLLAAGLALALLAPGWLYGLYKITEQGPLPATAAARDAYLARRLDGYEPIRWLNQRHGARYTVYALRGERLRYYADGRFLGDWSGPHRFARIEAAAARGGEALFDQLRALGVDYLLLRRDLRLPRDASFHQRFRPVRHDRVFELFALVEPAAEAGIPREPER